MAAPPGRGDLLYELDAGDDRRALAAFARALAAPPDCLARGRSAAAAAWMGAALLKQQRWADALAKLDRAIADGSEDDSAFANRALALEGLGRRGEAAAVWKDLAARVGQRDPGSALARKAAERAAALAPP